MKTALFANVFADVLYLGGDAMRAATVGVLPLLSGAYNTQFLYI